MRDETKYERTIAFARALPRLRRQVQRDLRRHGLPREKVIAAIVRLLETTLIRIGNEEYARENRSYGLSTLRNRHAKVRGSSLKLAFRGKAGKEHSVGLRDRRLAQVVRACQELPGQRLFQYVDEEGQPQHVDSDDVNAYLREAMGDDFSAKDVRTWAGTVLAAKAFQALDEEARSQQKSNGLSRMRRSAVGHLSSRSSRKSRRSSATRRQSAVAATSTRRSLIHTWTAIWPPPSASKPGERLHARQSTRPRRFGPRKAANWPATWVLTPYRVVNWPRIQRSGEGALRKRRQAVRAGCGHAPLGRQSRCVTIRVRSRV